MSYIAGFLKTNCPEMYDNCPEMYDNCPEMYDNYVFLLTKG